MGGFIFCGRHWEAVQKWVGDGADFYAKHNEQRSNQKNPKNPKNPRS